MSTEGNTRAKGRKPGTKRRRFQEIAEAVNGLSPDAKASVVEGPEGADAVSIFIGGNTAAHYRGHAGSRRAQVVRVRGEEIVDTGSHLYANTAVNYTEKDAGKVAAALLASVNRCRSEVLEHSLMLDVAERVNELRPGSEASVEADSPGTCYLDVKLDEQHRVYFGHDGFWGGSLIRRDDAGQLDYADRSFPTDVHHTETDPGVIAAAVVAAIADYVPEN